MNMIKVYKLYRALKNECFKTIGEKNKMASEINQLKFEPASLKSIHESLKLEHIINNRVIKNKEEEPNHLRQQLQDSYQSHVKAYLNLKILGHCFKSRDCVLIFRCFDSLVINLCIHFLSVLVISHHR